MDCSDGDNILLNLTTSSSKESSPVGIKKRKLDRVFDSRKQPRHVRKSANDSVKSVDSNNEVSKEEHCEKIEIISSLFKKNPDLPDISSDILPSELSNIPKKDETFSESEFRNLNLAPFMISNLEKNLHLKRMTSVQREAIPSLLSGKDLFVKSATGTGKTLSYIIPIVQTLQNNSPKIQRVDGPYCLILVPTRELASQTLKVLQQVLKPFIWIVPGSITGGERRKSEKARLRKGVNILVATPGRLIDHLKTTQCFTMVQLQWLVLDEADRLLDLGFEQDISFVLSTIKEQTSRKVQKVLLSATLSKGVENLLDASIENPVIIDMTGEGNSDFEQSDYQTPNLLEQYCVVVPMKLRLVTLAVFLLQKYQENCKVIVFFTTQDSVDFHFMLFSSTLSTVKGDSLMKLHGRLTQNERIDVFSKFRETGKGVLLCTDVAARGLDLPSVNWIVQYNPPASTTDYIHRVGRTARIGTSGQALLFLLPTEVQFLNILSEQNLRLNEVKMNDILTTYVRTLSGKKEINEEHLHRSVTEQHMKFEENVCRNKSLKQIALTAFHSFIGAYNTFPSSTKHVFHSRNLHLGHLAKSFALRETPSDLKQNLSLIREKKGRSSRKISEHSTKLATPGPLLKNLKKR